MPTLFTIGHSNQKAADFIELLEQYSIECVVDVRSKPRSRFPYFNRGPLEKRLRELGIDYLYLGDHLGGHPDDDSLYRDGRVVYERVAALSGFRREIRNVADKSRQVRLALMCSEEDPAKCHRHPLLATALKKRGVKVIHLRRDGTCQDADSISEPVGPQMPLLELGGEDLSWKSPKRIRPRGTS